MKKSILYLVSGTLVSFLLQYFLMESQGWQKDLYNAFAFGLGWGMAYFLDRPEWPLFKKLGISFVGVALIVVLGLLLFDFETAIPSIIKFSTVFVAYYLLASFKESKSLRQ